MAQPEGFDLGMPMDDGEMYVAGVEIVSFIDSAGNNCYRIRHDPTSQVSTLIGLMELAKMDLILKNRNLG